MIKPKSISEQLIFSTVRIEADNNIGTGFFFSFQLGDNKRLPLIITNKHVVTDAEIVSFSLHEAATGKGKPKPSGKFTKVRYKTNWLMHPEDDIDLCATLVQPLINQ